MQIRKRLTNLSASLLLAILGLLLIVSPVFAIAPPNSISVNSVYAYQHCLETNDQLYLVEYTIYYAPTGEPPVSTNPDENATEAYLVRFMDGLTELKAVAPYAYYDEGYGKGVAAIYFSASDPALPTWVASYTIRLVGNPTLAWTPSIPSTSVSIFDLWSSSTGITQTQSELTARILWLADMLEVEWGINMVDSTGTGSYLSSYGEAYFTNVIPNIRAMAPRAFAGTTTSPDWSTKETTTGYAEDRAASVEGTGLDLTPMAEWWGVSRMWTSSILYIIAGIIILYAALKPTGSFRGLVLVSTPLVIAGGYLGMIPLLATVLLGFAALAISIFMLFYHPSSV